MDDRVIDIGEARLRMKARHYYAAEKECAHQHLSMDDNGDIVQCEDCGNQVSAYWALSMLLNRLQAERDKVERREAEAKRVASQQLHLRAARRVEEAWRSRTTVPTCPHCRAGIRPEDGFGSSRVGRSIDNANRARRAAEIGKTMGDG